MIDPMRMCVQGRDEGALIRIPDFDCLIVAGTVYPTRATPPYTAHIALVPAQYIFDSLVDGIPDPDGTVLATRG